MTVPSCLSTSLKDTKPFFFQKEEDWGLPLLIANLVLVKPASFNVFDTSSMILEPGPSIKEVEIPPTPFQY